MLSKADVSPSNFMPLFVRLGLQVCFLVPTETGYAKSIMDATAPVRETLLRNDIHDYDRQGQGQANKVMVPSYFVRPDGSLKDTEASLYRPETKQGDPRIWFKGLKDYCRPYNLLGIVPHRGKLYVLNLSDPLIGEGLYSKESFVLSLLNDFSYTSKAVARELLGKIQEIHDYGYLPSITKGDPGVGDTLEHALGIMRNNSTEADYKGIELKAKRTSEDGEKKATTRQTIFSKTPDIGLTYREILDTYGKVQTPKGRTEPRLQLYETFRASKMNAYGLQLDVDENGEHLNMRYMLGERPKFVTAWTIENLKASLSKKHKETFWVSADCKIVNGIEYFRYDIVKHTANPRGEFIAPLLSDSIITLDLVVHRDLVTGKYRNHGILFKMEPEDLPKLFGEASVYDLSRKPVT